jgi:hypothetical protein
MSCAVLCCVELCCAGPCAGLRCIVKALGLDEGHAVCQALQDVKLAVNTGSYGPLESASGAVAVCVLADWFEVFTEVSPYSSGRKRPRHAVPSLLTRLLATQQVAQYVVYRCTVPTASLSMVSHETDCIMTV